MNNLYVKCDLVETTAYYDRPCTEEELGDDPTQDFDPNGFGLTDLEIALVRANSGRFYREDYLTQKTDWIAQPTTLSGIVLNHSFILYRRAYCGEAEQFLWKLAKKDPRVHRVLQQRPRFGLDLCVEYINPDGTIFEVLHWEYDNVDPIHIEYYRDQYQDKFLNMDWEFAAKQLLSKKAEWHDLAWFPQSKYKCDYFGIIPENFGMVLWK
jgi:hypothetical protein